MKNKVIAVLSALIVLLGGGVAYQFGSGDGSIRTDLYGSSTGTTLASSTSAIVAIGTEYEKVNINLKTSSTEAQSITINAQYSNADNCDDTSEWFSDTRNGAIVGFSTDPNNITIATSTFSIGVGAGTNRNTIQIGGNDVTGGIMNAKCVKITLNTSSTTIPAILWAEGVFSK